MVQFYKHDIPAWMDGTEGLSDGAYRAYHVIVQLIYLNEGPIALNDRGIAGRCKQSVRAFGRHLQELVEAKKILIEDDRISNFRAGKELENIRNNRENSRKGGENSGKSRSGPAKALKNNASDEATLREDRSLKEKTRLEKTREDVVSGTQDSDPRDTVSSRIGSEELLDRLIEAASGNVVHGAIGIEVVKPIYDLMAQGADLELDILPVVAEKVAPMREPLRMWSAAWLRDHILAAMAKRLRARGSLPRPVPDKATETEEQRHDRWSMQLRFWFKDRTWAPAWGNPPDSMSCEVPPDFVAQWKADNGFGEAA